MILRIHSSALLSFMPVLLLLATVGCGDGASTEDTPGGGGDTASGGSSGAASGGRPSSAGKGGSDSSAGSPSMAGSSSGSTGVNNGGGSGAWVDISPPGSNGDCSGVVVNRLTGDVLVDITNQGVWKSTNQGGDFTRVDGGVVGGLIVLGPGFDVDQENPTRVAAWSLDGPGGWTNDGKTWHAMTTIFRNWDFGSTDWASPDPNTMLVTAHEAGGDVYLSTDAGVKWEKMAFKVFASMGTVPPPEFAMVGVMDATTLIYSEGNAGGGIMRSTDTGKTFKKVSDLNPRTRVPVRFKEVFYLGGDGLMISKDKGATWEPQGANVKIFEGPYFGEDEKHIMMTNTDGVFLTDDAGTTWTKVAIIPPDFKYNPQVWGGFAWDHQGGYLYAAAVGKQLLQLKLE